MRALLPPVLPLLAGLHVVAVGIAAATPDAAAAPDDATPGAAPAEPDPASYAVVAIEVAGDADPELRAQVQAGLARGVAATGAGLVGYDEVQRLLAAKPALVGCTSTTCLASIADVVGTPLLLRVAVTATGANYELRLELIGPDGPVRQRTGSCTVCTVADLASLVATRVQDLLTATAGAPLPVEIATIPGGADLALDGKAPGTTPWKGELAPGTYRIALSKPGFLRTEQAITVEDTGAEQRFEVTLVPTTTDGAGRPTWPKWAVAGGAAAALITGGVLLAMDGDGTCSGNVTCPDVYDTGTAGAVVGVLGLAGAGVAGWLFYTEF